MPRPTVGIDGLAGTAPGAIGTLNRVQSPALGCPTQCDNGEVLVNQGGERHQTCGPGDVRHDESVEVVIHCPGDELAQGAVVAAVGTLHCREVAAALTLEDDYGRVSEPD